MCIFPSFDLVMCIAGRLNVPWKDGISSTPGTFFIFTVLDIASVPETSRRHTTRPLLLVGDEHAAVFYVGDGGNAPVLICASQRPGHLAIASSIFWSRMVAVIGIGLSFSRVPAVVMPFSRLRSRRRRGEFAVFTG